MTLLLPFLLALTAMAAPTELTLWHAYRGEERQALEDLLEQYDQDHPELRVVPLSLPYESFFTKLESAAPRGNGPDLFIAAHERVGSWAESGLVRRVWVTRKVQIHAGSSARKSNRMVSRLLEYPTSISVT